MKIRTGFVSNSSSSSFVVALPHKPKSVEELAEMLFTKYQANIQQCWEEKYHINEIAERIFSDIEEYTESASLEQVQEYSDGVYRTRNYDTMTQFAPTRNEYPNNEEEFLQAWDTFWSRMNKLGEESDEQDAKSFYEAHKDKFIVCLSYSDNNDDLSCVIEHGDVFRNVEHMVASHH